MVRGKYILYTYINIYYIYKSACHRKRGRSQEEIFKNKNSVFLGKMGLIQYKLPTLQHEYVSTIIYIDNVFFIIVYSTMWWSRVPDTPTSVCVARYQEGSWECLPGNDKAGGGALVYW